ncbi:deoxyribose-phosphate aldolase [Solirubrobacter ginsenosidimutans]|uniref:Deoxyribose-phosphate aldolase n=1 Tax=Solirubrobacter ginsenosidimutans TaxID=490573 RepID=A0A9X3S463_9ACTN|nr:deoxyribose-phosphate aldolase [Solirubrobacter ginsenosidimutans]MDA0164102.1 deoxyribose-phosphate aldolase [Solirubrobacter ginsenosidimutans]
MLDLTEIRARRPEAIAEAASARVRPAWPERLMVIAADHPGRGMLLGDRADLLDRLVVALSRPGVNGVLGTPDVLEDLLLLGALDDKVVFGSMNRGGLAGATWSLDDRFTAYDAAAIAAAGFEGGKMLLRLDPGDALTAPTLEACARAVGELAQRRLTALVEPFWNDTSAEGAMKAISVASALGRTSAYTWLKVPVVEDMERVMAASTLPALILGGGGPADFEAWDRALALPTVRGLVIGRSLLYPQDGDVAAAVDVATGLVMT